VAPPFSNCRIVRVDDGVAEGGEISVHYDPMIAKLITHGKDREHARYILLCVFIVGLTQRNKLIHQLIRIEIYFIIS